MRILLSIRAGRCTGILSCPADAIVDVLTGTLMSALLSSAASIMHSEDSIFPVEEACGG